MALNHLLIQSPRLSFQHFQPILHSPLIAPINADRHKFNVHCIVTYRTNIDTTIARRTANYQPSIWDQDFVQSLRSDYPREIYTKRAEMLKEEVRRMFNEASGSSSSLKLIDTIQRLGLDYHFNDEIKGTLNTILSTKDVENDVCEQKDLYTTALKFRLLRQHGYEVSQDIFKRYKEEISSDDVKAWTVKEIEGMLSLYEASFYAFEGEEILDEAQQITTRHLKGKFNNKGNIHICHPDLSKQVTHALELPLHWRVQRVESRWFIDTYQVMQHMDPLLLEFAILDFNMVQATYQEDLKYVSSWWQ